jgi:hypothetical protein
VFLAGLLVGENVRGSREREEEGKGRRGIKEKERNEKPCLARAA